MRVTHEILTHEGYSAQWLRVKWIGGVGSYREMRGGKVRMQVNATCSGYHTNIARTHVYGNSIIVASTPKHRGYRYAFCIEF